VAHPWAQVFAEKPGVYVVDSTSQVVEQLDRLYADDLAINF